MRWWWQPKPFVPCHPSCPVRVEQRIAEIEEMGPLEFWTPGEPVPVDVEAMKAQEIATMRRIVAEDFPPPCQRCPANRAKAGDYERMNRGSFWLAVFGLTCAGVAILASVLTYVSSR